MWSWEPAPLLGLALAAGLFGLGYWRLGRLAGGRARPPGWRVGCYAAGLGALVLAFCSPIDTLDERYFFVHMFLHLLLALVAPPLLWLGRPLVPLLWGLPPPARRRLGRWLGRARPLARVGHRLTTPGVALALYLGVIATWHVPLLYDLAQGPTPLHGLEHLTFLGAGLLYWWPILPPTGHRRLSPLGAGLPYLMAAGMEGGLLGGAFTISDRVFYPVFLRAAVPGGLSPLADQHLAGIVMWLLGGLVYATAAFALVGQALAAEDRAAASETEWPELNSAPFVGQAPPDWRPR